MSYRRRRKQGFRLGWANRQRLLWGVIGFVAGAVATLLVTSSGIDASSITRGLAEGVRGECSRAGTGEVVRRVEDQTGKTWPVVKHELKMEVAGQTLSDTACAVSGSASPFTHPSTGGLYFNNAESGTTVHVTGQKVDGRWVLYGHGWQD